MTTQHPYEPNQENEAQLGGIQPIFLSNPHPYPITLDLFNGFDGVNSSYYHEIKSTTPRLSQLRTNEDITVEDALFIQILGGDVEVTDLNTNTFIIYNGENILLEYGFNLTNQVRIRAINNTVSLIWTKGEFFFNDSTFHPRGVCALKFHPSTTDFYNYPLRWIKQDIYGNKVIEPITFDDFGPHFNNSIYMLRLNRVLSTTDSFQLVLPPASTLSIYLYSEKKCADCPPVKNCDLDDMAKSALITCSEPILPFWLILLLIIATTLMFTFRFERQN